MGPPLQLEQARYLLQVCQRRYSVGLEVRVEIVEVASLNGVGDPRPVYCPPRRAYADEVAEAVAPLMIGKEPEALTAAQAAGFLYFTDADRGGLHGIGPAGLQARVVVSTVHRSLRGPLRLSAMRPTTYATHPAVTPPTNAAPTHAG